LHAYLLGYASALHDHELGEVIDELGPPFNQWITARIKMSDEHESRLNARSPMGPEGYALLQSEDEHAAFETYVNLRLTCSRELGPGRCQPQPLWPALTDREHTLFGLLARVRQRPGMWFGNARVDNAWAMVSGYLTAERDHGIASDASVTMSRFQDWVDARYPFGFGLPWFRTFRLLMGPTSEVERFHEHLDLFLGGAPPDAPDPTMETMLDAIVQHAKGRKTETH
jgi:hypothetical protein